MSRQNPIFPTVARSDLALELAAPLLESHELPDGLSVHTRTSGAVEITCVTVGTPDAAKRLGKPRGRYITIETPPFWNSLLDPQNEIEAAADCIRSLLPDRGCVLVVGLGNNQITPDALGPLVVERILATRHLSAELARQIGLESLRKTAAIAPGVMGQTGIESGEIVSALVNFIRPAAVIVIDALAAQEYSRLGRTIQIADSGIAPGSGVQNSRKELSERTLGIPVISLGVPTVIDGSSLAGSILQQPAKNLPSCPASCAPLGSGTKILPRSYPEMKGFPSLLFQKGCML